jgi:DamX protein
MTEHTSLTAGDPIPMDCLLRHGLEKQPFDTVAGDTFLYSDPALDMVVGVLLEHLHNDQTVLLLKGDTGAGKSTQLLRLLSRGGESLEFCAFKARPGTGFTAVDYTIRQYWNPSTEEGDETLALDELICKVAAGGKHPTLVVDDAHHLDATVLSELLRLRRDVWRRCEVMPGLLLVGEPVLESNLQQAFSPDSPEEPHISVQLRPLTREQTEAYLRHRLQAAGADNADQLGGETALAIHQESGGLPIRINEAANRHLQGSRPTVTTPAGLLGSASLAAPLWRHRLFVPAVAVILLIGVVSIVVNLLSSPEAPLETREILPLPEPRPLTMPEPPPPPATVAQAPEVAPEPFPAPAEPPAEPAEEIPVPEAPPAPGPTPAEPAAGPPAPEVPPEAPRTEPRPEPQVQPQPAEPAGLRDAAWLQARPANHYTIQILGLSDLQALRRYGQEQGLEMELAWFRTRRNGEDWYVLVAGSYPDQESARADIARLPEPVRRNQPWIRSFGSIHQAMEQAR